MIWLYHANFYLLDVLGNIVRIFESRAVSLVNRLHTLLESLIWNGFAEVMNSFMQDIMFCFRFIDWHKLLPAQCGVSWSYNVLVFDRWCKSLFTMTECSTSLLCNDWIIVKLGSTLCSASLTMRPEVLAGMFAWWLLVETVLGILLKLWFLCFLLEERNSSCIWFFILGKFLNDFWKFANFFGLILARR